MSKAKSTAVAAVSAPPVGKLAYTVSELSAATSICRSKLYAEMKAGKLRPSKVGDRTIFTAAEVDRWLAASMGAAA